MKTLKTLVILVVFFAANTVLAQSVTDKWAAIKSLHDVMSKAFHPTEEGNFKPLRSLSQELMDKASALNTQPIPHEYQTKAIMASVSRLQEKTKEIHKFVMDKASDSQLNPAMISAHDIFHEIVGLCSKEKEHHH